MSRKTTHDFIQDAIKVHGSKYDYSAVYYENNKTPVTIICPIHGEFEQRPDMHIHRSNGCKSCANVSMREKRTKPLEQFVQDAIKIHGNQYSYDLVEYKGNKIKIKIVCPAHGIFEQKPNSHLNGQGCPICANRFTRTTEQFIEDAQKVHGDKYDYSESVYVDSITKLIIICKSHGKFMQTPNNHFNNHGCPDCAIQKSTDLKLKSLEEFLACAIKVHGNEYDYSLTKYEHSKSKIAINCKKHGTFLQTPNAHLQGQGCPNCKASKGEKAIRRFLECHNISFTQQMKFDDCRDVKQLPFDFYVKDINLLIEFDGRQHDEVVSIFGGEEGLADRIRKDQIKNDYAVNNKIGLIRITDINQINEILTPWIDLYNEVQQNSEQMPIQYIYHNGNPLIDDLDWYL